MDIFKSAKVWGDLFRVITEFCQYVTVFCTIKKNCNYVDNSDNHTQNKQK